MKGVSGATRGWNDDQLIDLVWRMRKKYGACTRGLLATETGLSKTMIALRLEPLLAGGRLTESSVVGSLRTADETARLIATVVR